MKQSSPKGNVDRERIDVIIADDQRASARAKIRNLDFLTEAFLADIETDELTSRLEKTGHPDHRGARIWFVNDPDEVIEDADQLEHAIVCVDTDWSQLDNSSGGNRDHGIEILSSFFPPDGTEEELEETFQELKERNVFLLSYTSTMQGLLDDDTLNEIRQKINAFQSVFFNPEEFVDDRFKDRIWKLYRTACTNVLNENFQPRKVYNHFNRVKSRVRNEGKSLAPEDFVPVHDSGEPVMEPEGVSVEDLAYPFWEQYRIQEKYGDPDEPEHAVEAIDDWKNVLGLDVITFSIPHPEDPEQETDSDSLSEILLRNIVRYGEVDVIDCFLLCTVPWLERDSMWNIPRAWIREKLEEKQIFKKWKSDADVDAKEFVKAVERLLKSEFRQGGFYSKVKKQLEKKRENLREDDQPIFERKDDFNVITRRETPSSGLSAVAESTLDNYSAADSFRLNVPPDTAVGNDIYEARIICENLDDVPENKRKDRLRQAFDLDPNSLLVLNQICKQFSGADFEDDQFSKRFYDKLFEWKDRLNQARQNVQKLTDYLNVYLYGDASVQVTEETAIWQALNTGSKIKHWLSLQESFQDTIGLLEDKLSETIEASSNSELRAPFDAMKASFEQSNEDDSLEEHDIPDQLVNLAHDLCWGLINNYIGQNRFKKTMGDNDLEMEHEINSICYQSLNDIMTDSQDRELLQSTPITEFDDKFKTKLGNKLIQNLKNTLEMLELVEERTNLDNFEEEAWFEDDMDDIDFP